MSDPSISRTLDSFINLLPQDSLPALSLTVAVIAGSTRYGINTVVQLTNNLSDASIGELWCCQLPNLLVSSCPTSHPYFSACISSVNVTLPILETVAITALAVAAVATIHHQLIDS